MAKKPIPKMHSGAAGPSARDISEVRSGKGSPRDRAEVGGYSRSSKKRSKKK